ncbi:MAG: 30S ribosome-binding factor RbfA [Bacteroidales bacterium]|jgi:ribosome-binding factor A|nr:30S ribosome-binding factor RbfA [Bacteroidales bacterium]
MDQTRLQKVSRLLQKDMGDILQKEANDLFFGALITITQVKVSPDLSIARLYVSIFPLHNKSVDFIFKLLNEKKALLRMRLAARVKNQLRIIPQISFFIDDSLDYLENIDRLLKK